MGVRKQQVKKITNFALDADEKTLEQFKDCYSEPYVLKAALMPDAHVGYVAPIGAVLATKDHIVPAWVGYDIGCGMTAAKLPKNILTSLRENSKEIYREVKKRVPMGLGKIHKNERKITLKTQEEFKKILTEFKKGPYDRQVLDLLESGKALRNLGTLGSGNHFIEMDFDDLGFMILNPQYDIVSTITGDADTIYVVKERATNQQFIFATKSCPLPPGF